MQNQTLPVLLVDDEPQLLNAASIALRSSGGVPVKTQSDSRVVMAMLAQEEFGAVVLDLTMPHTSGGDLLRQISETHPDIPVIVMTATNDLDTAVECMREGAIDYLVKPVDKNRLVTAVMRGLEMRSLRAEIIALKDSMLDGTPRNNEVFAEMLTQNKGMTTIFRYLEAIGPSPRPVLITGESGTGKELVAQALHKLSNRPGEMMAFDVNSVDQTMFADTLFGHVKGAFTGADRDREGFIATAGNGTLFLDEIGDLSLDSQQKLLRLLQEGTYSRLGSNETRTCKARIITATNRDVKADVESGRFRKDLYFRLRIHHLHLPSLSARLGDLPILVGKFVAEAAKENHLSVPEIPDGLLPLLRSYSWPGNVRELKDACFDAVVRSQGRPLSLQDFRAWIAGKPLTLESDDQLEKIAAWLPDDLPTLKEAEDALIAEALRRVEGNQTTAAGMLGITRQALNKRLSRKKDTVEPEDQD